MIDEVDTGRVLWGAVVFGVALMLAVVARRVLVVALDREGSERHTGRMIGRLLGVVIVIGGLVYALEIAGVRVGPMLGALGIGGIALAFAAQDVLSNFIAGVLLQVRRPFTVGDEIGSGDYEGRVVDINLRTVRIRTYDGLTVYLPNAEVLQSPIVNFTKTSSNRTSITVGVAYDSDLERVRELLLEACGGAEGVNAFPEPEVWVESFGESSIDIAVRYWHAADIASRWRTRNAVAMAVKSAFDRAGVVIPFPQRTVWLGAGSATLRLEPDRTAPGDRAAAETEGDGQEGRDRDGG
ncbi:mechanosensitive ion channel family protein [Nocardioides sp. GY 10113]|uniref:mechanosensitive ion channel family protein n=1 Tax=Nocardioides sp. GY 10113 TaxID=2569761 RepID=UPI0010A919C5|nr:mechanosensitive ion channel family protein [Nocardioides sp. GY 10113]TIC79672.1 mechanosensitive ion channel family protein [Nocardioides sp. GY 10113]TIC85797.1 mechanosensitive ion channel family protein [Nocardioides sp. GY 10113]